MNNKFLIAIFPIIFLAIFFGLIFIFARSIGKRYHRNYILLFLGIILLIVLLIVFMFNDIDIINIVFALIMFIVVSREVFLQIYSIKKKNKSILLILPIMISTIGIVGFLGGYYVSFFMYKIIPDSFEMPLGHLKGLAVDSEGNIYCGAHFYSRFQVYDREGRFLYGKFIDTSGAFKIKINSNDQLEIMAYRGNKKFIFDKDGTLLSHRTRVPNYKAGFENIDDYVCYDQKQDIKYSIKPILLPNEIKLSPFGSQVVKKDASGKETVIIKTPFYKWIFMGPFPSIFLAAVGGFFMFAFDQDFRNQMSKSMVPKTLSK